MLHHRIDAAQSLTAQGAAAPPRVGLLAAWGRYPVVLAEALTNRGCQVHCLGVRGLADRSALERVSSDFAWVGLARLGQSIRHFQRRGARDVIMAGKVFKSRIFRRFGWVRLLPDWRTAKLLYKNLTSRSNHQDDTLLSAIVEDFAREGLIFRPPTDYVPELLAPRGQMTRRGPNSLERADIAYGWRVARELGRLDVGQSVAVRRGTALAVEAIEGTDRCIERAGDLCRGNGFTVVKVSKPQQDMRFDVPTVGIGTLEQMVRAGATCLGIEADRTIVIDRPQVVRFADRHRIAIVALSAENVAAAERTAARGASEGPSGSALAAE